MHDAYTLNICMHDFVYPDIFKKTELNASSITRYIFFPAKLNIKWNIY